MKDLTQRDPRTYAIIGAAIEVHDTSAVAFSNQSIRKR
jgi:hypothetical protein